MTVPFACVLVAILLAYLAKLPVMKAMAKLGGYDNRHPRSQQERLEGWGKRALAAHQNSFEALTFFAPCVFINHLTEAPSGPSAILSIFFVISRVLYIGLYIADRASLRSLSWFFGIGISFVLALLSVFTG